ncbi:MAG TPA: sigma-70 family RNA polymerase sigma factor [Rugosimonospora sp.]|nr:sigma-70 family RNA polymerase sigma factor [Rugosimonospora sp.]
MTDVLNHDGLSTPEDDRDGSSGGQSAAVLGADFDTFCEQTKVGAMTFARAYAGQHRDLADDAVQEAYLRMMRRWPLRTGEPFTANRNYLLKIVVREVSRVRQRAQRELLLDDRVRPEVAAEVDVAAAVVDATALRAFLEALPYEQRAVGVLHFEFGMAPAEIAEVLQTKSSTVRTQLQRLRAKAARYFRAEDQESQR